MLKKTLLVRCSKETNDKRILSLFLYADVASNYTYKVFMIGALMIQSHGTHEKVCDLATDIFCGSLYVVRWEPVHSLNKYFSEG